MSFNHLTHTELHSHIYRKQKECQDGLEHIPTGKGYYDTPSLSLTDTSPVGSLPTCILPIHSLFHILPRHYLSKMYKRNLKIWFYLKKHIHLNWAAYCPLIFYPQSIFFLPFELLAKSLKSTLPSYSTTHWFLTTTGSWLHTTQHFPYQPVGWKAQQGKKHILFSRVF